MQHHHLPTNQPTNRPTSTNLRQGKYKGLSPGSAAPATLHSDLVRLTKLAKVGQAGVAGAAKECCAGAGAAPFAAFTAALEGAVNAAEVNATAIAEALAGGAAGGGAAGAGAGGEGASAALLEAGGRGSSTAGRLIVNGGVAGCAGDYEALLTGERLDLTTDGLGGFEVRSPQLAQYRFARPGGGECRDAVTGAPVRFPMTLYLPHVASTVINPLSLLTVPAAEDASVAALYGGSVTDGRAPGYLWTHAYKIFGYDATELGVRGGGAVFVLRGGLCFGCFEDWFL
jgi:hypothetical protein